jgi:carbonic anhydrase
VALERGLQTRPSLPIGFLAARGLTMSVDRLIEAARTFGDRISTQRREFAELASGQRPTTLFISCSDSRVVPVLITDARPGELFELRTAGAIVPAYSAESPCGVSATIEFALEEIGVRHIVVCGHSHCGAVRCARSSPLHPGPPDRPWSGGCGSLTCESRSPGTGIRPCAARSRNTCSLN